MFTVLKTGKQLSELHCKINMFNSPIDLISFLLSSFNFNEQGREGNMFKTNMVNVALSS